MTTPTQDVIDVGLDQIPTDGLKRLIAHIDAGKPVLLDGHIYSRQGGG